jgi:hypothetical protein
VNLVFSVLGIVAFLVVLLWLIGLPGDEDEEELAGLVAGNWERIENRVDF